MFRMNYIKFATKSTYMNHHISWSDITGKSEYVLLETQVEVNRL